MKSSDRLLNVLQSNVLNFVHRCEDGFEQNSQQVITGSASATDYLSVWLPQLINYGKHKDGYKEASSTLSLSLNPSNKILQFHMSIMLLSRFLNFFIFQDNINLV